MRLEGGAEAGSSPTALSRILAGSALSTRLPDERHETGRNFDGRLGLLNEVVLGDRLRQNREFAVFVGSARTLQQPCGPQDGGFAFLQERIITASASGMATSPFRIQDQDPYASAPRAA
ncbi:hypothetical protein IP69_13315 [Bosea sp. AAP35]|nr:hypothetical protein IP69_13315 [Bosea sp. AAP35]